MTTQLEQELAAAEETRGFDGRASALKAAVADSFSRIDRGVEPKFTAYFNHAWIPDLVLEWPKEKRERFVYLRGEGLPSWWESDLHELGQKRPMMVSIDAAGDTGSDRVAMPDVQEAAAANDTWITSARGLGWLDGLASGSQMSEPSRLMSTALLKGGRGVADLANVESLVSITDQTFVSAATLDSVATGAGIEEIDASLNDEQSGRFSRVLRAIWEGSGGDDSAFPRSRSLGPLTVEDIQYLVESLDDATDAFWRSIGRTITTAQVAALHLDSTRDSFQRLVGLNSDRLTAKAIRVAVAEGLAIDEPRWGITSGNLTFNIGGSVLAIAAQRRDELVGSVTGDPLRLQELRARLAHSDAVATQVDLVRRDGASARFEVGESGDLLSDLRIDQAVDAFESDRVRSVVLQIPGSGHVSVELESLSASAPTSAVHALDRFLAAVVPVLVPGAQFPSSGRDRTGLAESGSPDGLF